MSTRLIKVADATGPVLDWLVAKADGEAVTKFAESPSLFRGAGLDKYTPSANWAQGGPIIEREHIDLYWDEEWYAKHPAIRPRGRSYRRGPTPLIAAMRCYVASRLGNEVEVPEELL